MNRKEFKGNFPGILHPLAEELVAFVPNPLPVNAVVSPEVVRLSEVCLHSLGHLEGSIGSLPNPDLITSPFLRREAVLSSKIEGTHTELEQLYLFESEGVDDDGVEEGEVEEESRSYSDAKEVHNYVRALEYGLSGVKKLPICNRLLREMHEILLEGVQEGRTKDPGQFRRRQAYVGSQDIKTARYVAPPASFIENLMSDLESYIHHAQGSLPVLVRIAMIHYQFEAIHPFSDGNGRLGRLLISLLLCEYRILDKPLLYLSAYFERNREEYNQRLWQVSCSGAWNEWFLFFLEGVKLESKDAIDRAHSIVALRESYRALFQKSRGSASILALVDALFQQPVITTNGAAKIMGVTWSAANKSIAKLAKAKILFPLGERRRNKRYYARPILSALSD